MKRMFLFIITFILLTGCAATKLHTEQYKNKEILVGNGQIKDIQKKEYKKWFDENSNNYSSNKKMIEKLSPVINNYQFKIVMGTWCPDSRLQVPIFYKVLKESGYKNLEKIPVVYVPRKYKTFNPVKDMQIKRVPTIIVLKNKNEIGRIIEYPMQTIEEDLYKIINGQYKHELSD